MAGSSRIWRLTATVLRGALHGLLRVFTSVSLVPARVGTRHLVNLTLTPAGIAIGRVCLPIVNTFVGESRIVLIYIILAGALQAVSWAVKSFLAVRYQQAPLFGLL